MSVLQSLESLVLKQLEIWAFGDYVKYVKYAELIIWNFAYV